MQQEVANIMRTDPLPYEVRELVLRTFQDFGVSIFSPLDLDETILVDDGRYAARTYKIDGYMAMWLLGIGIVQFYDAEGNMLLTVNLLEELTHARGTPQQGPRRIQPAGIPLSASSRRIARCVGRRRLGLIDEAKKRTPSDHFQQGSRLGVGLAR